MSSDKAILASQGRTARVVRKLKDRGVTDDYCPRCGVFDWNVDFLELSARPAADNTGGSATASFESEPYLTSPFPTGFLRVVCFVCKNCGYALFHDLSVLEKSE